VQRCEKAIRTHSGVLLRVGGRRTGGRSAPAPRAIRTNAGDGCGHATALFGQIPVMLGSAGADLFGQTPVKGLPPYSDKCRWSACTSIRTNTGDVLAPHPTVGQRRTQARGAIRTNTGGGRPSSDDLFGQTPVMNQRAPTLGIRTNSGGGLHSGARSYSDKYR
jgi:hypothetical protein